MYSSQTEIHTQIDEENENIYNSVLLFNFVLLLFWFHDCAFAVKTTTNDLFWFLMLRTPFRRL